MKFISIAALATAAKARGFRVHLSHDNSYAELHAPEHDGAKAVIWSGATYSTADIILTDRPGGYGYNPFFYGPFHPGLCRSTSFGVQKFLSHPAMLEMAA